MSAPVPALPPVADPITAPPTAPAPAPMAVPRSRALMSAQPPRTIAAAAAQAALREGSVDGAIG